MQQTGGEELGRGGQGRVNTMDDLFSAVGNREKLRLVAVDLSNGKILRPEISTSEIASWKSAVVFKRPLPGIFAPTDVNDEFEGNIDIGLRIAQGISKGTVKRDDVVRVLDAHTSFLTLDKGRLFVVGIEGDSVIPPSSKVKKEDDTEDRKDGDMPWPWEVDAEDRDEDSSSFAIFSMRYGANGNIAFPVYKRLSGNLYDLQRSFLTKDARTEGLTAGHLLRAAEAVLQVIDVLSAVGVHHADIKEENVMWTVAQGCREMVLNGKGSKGCKFSFYLTDFGMGPVMSTRPSMKPGGTKGYISAVLFIDDYEGRARYINHLEKLGIPDSPHGFPRPSEIWASYVGQRPSFDHASRSKLKAAAKARAETTYLVKNDLNGLGILLAVAEGIPKVVSDLAAKLVLGADGGVWNSKKALKACRDAIRRATPEDMATRVDFYHAIRASRPNGQGPPRSARVSDEVVRIRNFY
jgi:hypothetical protein